VALTLLLQSSSNGTVLLNLCCLASADLNACQLCRHGCCLPQVVAGSVDVCTWGDTAAWYSTAQAGSRGQHHTMSQQLNVLVRQMQPRPISTQLARAAGCFCHNASWTQMPAT
jgi:hypothetical protein